MKELLHTLSGGAQNGDAQYCCRQVLGLPSALPAAPHVSGKNELQFLPQPAGGRTLRCSCTFHKNLKNRPADGRAVF